MTVRNSVLMTQMIFLIPAFDWSRPPTATLDTDRRVFPVRKLYMFATLAVVSVASLMASLYHMPIRTPQPFRPGPRILRAGIWTIHFGLDNVGRDSQRGIRNLIRYMNPLFGHKALADETILIRDMELDVLGLLETDLHVSMLHLRHFRAHCFSARCLR